jgi:hypothetical protein
VTALGGGPFNWTAGNEIGAGAGTIYTKAPSQNVGSVLVDNGGNSGMLTPLTTPEAFALTITNGGSGGALAPLTLGALHLATNGSLTQLAGSTNLTVVVLSDAVIDVGGALTVDGKGYPIGTNLGPGAAPANPSYYAGGAGYGGLGGSAWGGSAGGPVCGSVMQPVDLGSAGATGNGQPGSAGGGALRLTVNGTLTVNGIISANGTSLTASEYHGGCGSGGSLWLSVGALQGGGVISANGGSGAADGNGGAGGGGRIAIYYTNAPGFDFASQATALGGGPFNYVGNGMIGAGAGTIYTEAASQTVGSVLVANGGNSGMFTPLTSPGPFNLTVSGNASVSASQGLTLTALHLCTNGFLTDLAGDASLDVVVLSNALIDQGGVLTADAKGYPIGNNRGPGAAPNTNTYAGGGGYGGPGGTGYHGSPGGPTYGSLMQPVDLGSAGGTGNGEPGSAGGGAIRFTVAGTLLLNGTISANGVSFTPGHGGCGSGGSIWLTTGTLQGSGSISANGGTGRSDCDGGGGGGGRIALYYGTNVSFDLAQQLSASGGGPFTCSTFGQTGTVYIATTTLPPSLTVLSSVPNGGLPRPFADYIELVFSEAINSATFTPADVTITTPSGQIPAAQMTVSNTGGTRWRVAFPRQTANGSYEYVVGPHIADLFGTEMAGSFSGSFVLSQTEWPNRVSFTPTASALQLAIPSLIGMDYQILWSTDLINWQSLGPVIPGDGTTLNWTIPTANPPADFFRIQISGAP